MTTSFPGDDQGRRPVLRPSILTGSFDGFLAQAEHELLCRRREVRALRRRARRQRRRELSLRTRTVRLVGRAAPVGLAGAGAIAFFAGVILLVVGNISASKDAFALSAAAWGATTAIRVPLATEEKRR